MITETFNAKNDALAALVTLAQACRPPVVYGEWIEGVAGHYTRPLLSNTSAHPMVWNGRDRAAEDAKLIAQGQHVFLVGGAYREPDTSVPGCAG